MRVKAMLLAVGTCLTILGAGACASGYIPVAEEPAPRVSYVYEMEAGDTVYDVATRVATPKENINRLSWQICRDNGITDPGAVQPGTRLTIQVDPASEVLHGDR